MNKIKFWIIGLLLGQTLTLLYKDKALRDKLSKNDWFEKIKILVNELVDLNKRIFFDIKSYDYEWKTNEVKAIINMEIKKIEKKIHELKKKASKLNKTQIQPLIAEFEQKASEYSQKAYELKDHLNSTIKDLNEKYQIEEKIENIKESAEQFIESLKAKISK